MGRPLAESTRLGGVRLLPLLAVPGGQAVSGVGGGGVGGGLSGGVEAAARSALEKEGLLPSAKRPRAPPPAGCVSGG